MSRARYWSALAAVGLVPTLLMALVPGLYFAYRAPTTRAVLETAVALVATLVAFLVLGRFRRLRRLSDLAICSALVLLAVAYPVFVALPRALWPTVGEQVATWAPLGARMLAGAVLAAASTVMTSSRRPPFARRVRLAVLLATAAVAIGIVVLVVVAPQGAASTLPAELSEGPEPLVTGSP